MDIGLEWMAPSHAQAHVDWAAARNALARLPTVRQSVTMRATLEGPAQSTTAFQRMAGAQGQIMAHATVGALGRDVFEEWVTTLRPLDVGAVLCMRGDVQLAANPFATVLDMIQATAATGWAEPWVAAAPDGHPDSRGDSQDFDWLLRKIDAGAVGVITQALFDADRFLDWRDRLAVVRPGFLWVAGVVPVREWARTERFAHRCGVPLPTHLTNRLANLAPEDATRMARAHMTGLIERLAREGCDGVHVFTLNSAQGVAELLDIGNTSERLAA